ncbi:hypothetical protein CCZ01_02555 [Helicobacter monodelphidis]|uniref:hemolysin family protein n=1 Tax=Helicobacter sp. 15-1451 TaxID=2004995 RepID=UPI000DCEAC08|nr:hemolysin family protein [Helicobacter sp. 15-1451]RAX58681.1 hypothetical protein CCZ01_02555 [Helicobacter sp. 15-1451]
MDPYSIMMLILAFLLVALNAFFVLSEFSIVKVRRSRLEELVKRGNNTAKLALKISGNLDTYLSANQLGITLASLALGWIAEPAIEHLLIGPITFLSGGNEATAKAVSVVITFVIITFLHVVLGELVPKSLAIAKTERAVLLIARPLHIFWLLFYPLIRLFDLTASLFLKLMKIEPAKESDLAHSEEELKIIVGESLKGGHINILEGEIIKNAVDFSDTIAKEVMTPRKDMICLNANADAEENMDTIIHSGFTRFPYYVDSKDNIKGMIHIRDILEIAYKKEQIDFEKIVRPMIIVPETAPIAKILTNMNKNQIHTALVIDEYGGTSGMITMEDIIEEVMGDISDEHDDKKSDGLTKIDEDNFEVDGKYEIFVLEEEIGIEFEEHRDEVSIGGYVFSLIGTVPSVGDKISDSHAHFEVLEMEGNRIQRIKISRRKESEQEFLE